MGLQPQVQQAGFPAYMPMTCWLIIDEVITFN